MKSRNHQIGVTKGMSGYFAVMYAEFEDSPGQWMMDVHSTGLGRYAERDLAVAEAKSWAQNEEVPYIGGDE